MEWLCRLSLGEELGDPLTYRWFTGNHGWTLHRGAITTSVAFYIWAFCNTLDTRHHGGCANLRIWDQSWLKASVAWASGSTLQLKKFCSCAENRLANPLEVVPRICWELQTCLDSVSSLSSLWETSVKRCWVNSYIRLLAIAYSFNKSVLASCLIWVTFSRGSLNSLFWESTTNPKNLIMWGGFNWDYGIVD